MCLSERLQHLLTSEYIPYRVERSHDALDAQHMAAPTGRISRVLARPVILRDETGGSVMVALPAQSSLRLHAIQQISGRAGLRLASAVEVATLFPDCERGAIPPFGQLYGMTLYADFRLTEADEIAFCGGTQTGLVHMHVEDWLSIARPIVGAWGLDPGVSCAAAVAGRENCAEPRPQLPQVPRVSH